MAAGLQRFQFHVSGSPEEAAAGAPAVGVRGIGRVGVRGATQSGFHTAEAAARHYLGALLGRDARPGIKGISAPERPEAVPDMSLLDQREVLQTQTTVVRFRQTKSTIPVFGSLAVVEIDAGTRNLISATAEVGDIPAAISPVATLSPTDAVAKVLAAVPGGAVDTRETTAPELCFFHDEGKGAWHLAYYVRNVRGIPKGYVEPERGHGLGRSPRSVRPVFDFLVDAHDGAVLYYFSAAPTLEIPVKMHGVDEYDVDCDFWGNCSPDQKTFSMSDPIRLVKTFDMKFGDIDSSQAFPKDVISNTQADLGKTVTAAVSAHANGTNVYDFYKGVMLRDSIDDKGMELVSVVNCTYPADEPAPEWHNAVWYDGRMWYGQVRSGSGFSSFSRYLDVIGHELTHGVTEHTSNLVYRDQSGALNESFSDILGITIRNWYEKSQTTVDKWDWELGRGLGDGGLPLRDLSDPKRTGDPDHMRDFLHTSADQGGVHTNSNIHNKAAYNVFVAKDGRGGYLFTPKEVATLYYLCLTRLGRMATFSQALAALLTVARTYYLGNPAESQAKTDAITQAYASVGIQ